MSAETIFLLVVLGLFILVSTSFFYGFKLGVRAERTDWDLRRMFNLKEKPAKEKSLKQKPPKQEEPISELQVAVNEQLGFWQKEPDSVDTDFCEKYMNTLKHLRLYINRTKRESSKKWNRIKPVWEEMDFDRVTINTCLNYHLSKEKLVGNLNSLLEGTGGHARLLNLTR